MDARAPTYGPSPCQSFRAPPLPLVLPEPSRPIVLGLAAVPGDAAGFDDLGAVWVALLDHAAQGRAA